VSNPLHASHYADGALVWQGPILENLKLARDTYRVRIGCAHIAARILPGQFVMLRLAGCDDPLLGRALALYDVFDDAGGNAAGIDLVYLVVGKLTRRLAESAPGTEVSIWGPLGNGFPPREAEHLIMVAGGIGQTPFVALGAEYLGRRKYGDPPRERTPARKVSLCYGARTAALLAGVDDFRRAGMEVHLSTDDGTGGHHGLVTALLERLLEDADPNSAHIVCCGPEPMMEAVCEIALRRGFSCDVSLETPMACGIGICFSCVAKVLQPDGNWDYKRTCVEGPIFPAERIVW